MKENPFDKSIFFDQAVEVLPEELDSTHSCLVLAPHPDDESLGCGGLISLLRHRGVDVSVVVTTDGTQSHPNSKAFPAEKLKSLRKEEVLSALAVLGVAGDRVFFFEGKDTALPAKGQEDFEFFLQKLIDVIEQRHRDLILVPYELDPHCDHRATWDLLNEALKNYHDVKVWEYPIWLYELASRADIPRLKAGELKKVDIEPFLLQKKKAIACHASQTTRMIDDDPSGFILTAQVMAHFTTPFEYFLERR